MLAKQWRDLDILYDGTCGPTNLDVFPACNLFVYIRNSLLESTNSNSAVRSRSLILQSTTLKNYLLRDSVCFKKPSRPNKKHKFIYFLSSSRYNDERQSAILSRADR